MSISEARKSLPKIGKLLQNGEEYIIITKNGKPYLKVTLAEQDNVSERIGFAKGSFTVPDYFDEIDISHDFHGEIF